MTQEFRLGDHVYHYRNGDLFAMQGSGTLMKVEGVKGEIRWDRTGRTVIVDLRDLILSPGAPSLDA